MKTIKEISELIPAQYLNNIEKYPNVLHLFNLAKKGLIAHVNVQYDFHLDRGDLFYTKIEINKARCKRVNEKNKRRYGKNWFNIRNKFLNYHFTGTCNICKKSLTKKDASVDHIIKVADGGTSDLSNLQFLCKECHFEKDKDLERNKTDSIDENLNRERFFMKKYGLI